MKIDKTILRGIGTVSLASIALAGYLVYWHAQPVLAEYSHPFALRAMTQRG
jgi:hypothetical protein